MVQRSPLILLQCSNVRIACLPALPSRRQQGLPAAVAAGRAGHSVTTVPDVTSSVSATQPGMTKAPRACTAAGEPVDASTSCGTLLQCLPPRRHRCREHGSMQHHRADFGTAYHIPKPQPPGRSMSLAGPHRCAAPASAEIRSSELCTSVDLWPTCTVKRHLLSTSCRKLMLSQCRDCPNMTQTTIDLQVSDTASSACSSQNHI